MGKLRPERDDPGAGGSINRNQIGSGSRCRNNGQGGYLTGAFQNSVLDRVCGGLGQNADVAIRVRSDTRPEFEIGFWIGFGEVETRTRRSRVGRLDKSKSDRVWLKMSP